MAIKFFLDQRAYTMEANVHNLPQLKSAKFPETTFYPNIDNSIRAHNYIFPAHTVTPMGQPLEKLMAEDSIDTVTAVQVRRHIPNYSDRHVVAR